MWFWGSSCMSGPGRLSEKILRSSGACLYNKKQPFYYNTGHNTFSHLDLVMGSAVHFSSLVWDGSMAPYTSDHFPSGLTLVGLGLNCMAFFLRQVILMNDIFLSQSFIFERGACIAMCSLSKTMSSLSLLSSLSSHMPSISDIPCCLESWVDRVLGARPLWDGWEWDRRSNGCSYFTYRHSVHNSTLHQA